MPKTLKEVIDSLPTSVPDLVNFLVLNNCKGYREDAFSCPLAVYFKSQTGHEATVTGVDVSIFSEDNGETDQYESCTEAMSTFVYKFDGREFPELEVSEE